MLISDTLTEIALVESRMQGMVPSVFDAHPLPNTIKKHAYARATVVQGHTTVCEFFYLGTLEDLRTLVEGDSNVDN
jgi:hypothetical protein